MTATPNAAQLAYWNGENGQRWSSRVAITERIFAPLSARVLSAAAAVPSDRVLDIGCGCGGNTLNLARTAARVVGIDISQPMLAFARSRAEREGIRNASFVEADASTHRFDPGSFTLAFSQFGVMFFDDPVAAFTNIRSGLAGGRLAFVCWRPLAENTWQSIPARAVDRVLPPAAPSDPQAPGPFAFAHPDRVRGVLGQAGFHDVTVTPHDAELRIGDDVRDAATVAAGFGAAARRLVGVEQQLFDAAVDAIADALHPYRRSDGVYLGAAVWLVTARS
jgi:SAM-dependent methyltransferase